MWEYLELLGMQVEEKSGRILLKARFFCPDRPWTVAQVRWFTDEDTAVLTVLQEQYEPLGPAVDDDGEHRGKLAFKRKIPGWRGR